MGSKRHTILLTKIFTFTIKKYNNNLNAHNSSDSGSCLPGGFSNTLGRMLADSGNRQMLDCLPLLTLGKMLQEKMVHQSEALWALGSKAEKWGRGDCASSHFHCCMMGKLPLPSQKIVCEHKVDRPLKVEVSEQNCETKKRYFLSMQSPWFSIGPD